MSPPAVEIDGLGRRFGQQWAARKISFGIEAGQIMGFIGPNGAGKSTTMRILATLDLPTEGSCRVAGLDCVDDADGVRRRIGFMPDHYGAYPNLTVGEYLDFFARAHGLDPATRQRAISDITAFCQLGGMIDKLATTLSKGMKQRLCLGRCLIHDPTVLILDEPTAGLDPRARIEFRDLLRLLAEQGRAILISSHILSELEETCDRVAIIEQGRLIAEGSVAAVKAQARAAGDLLTGSARTVRLELRLAGEHEHVATVLAEQPDLSEVRDEGHGAWTARFTGDSAAQAALLLRLLQGGLRIYHCAARAENLEDAFMHLTKGVVR